MQINWDKAPDWANYAAMDENGEWWWYETMPHSKNSTWFAPCGEALIAADTERRNQDWRQSLVKRGELTSVESPATLNALDNDYFA